MSLMDMCPKLDQAYVDIYENNVYLSLQTHHKSENNNKKEQEKRTTFPPFPV